MRFNHPTKDKLTSMFLAYYLLWCLYGCIEVHRSRVTMRSSGITGFGDNEAPELNHNVVINEQVVFTHGDSAPVLSISYNPMHQYNKDSYMPRRAMALTYKLTMSITPFNRIDNWMLRSGCFEHPKLLTVKYALALTPILSNSTIFILSHLHLISSPSYLISSGHLI